MKNAGRILVALALIAGFVLVPRVSGPQVERDWYMEWMQGEEVAWKGVVRVWNVYDADAMFDRDFLKTTIAKFEKRHKGVYVDLYTLSVSEAQSRLKTMPPPEIWIYPLTSAADEVDYVLLQRVERPEATQAEFEFDVAPRAQDAYGKFGMVMNAADEAQAKEVADLCAYLAVNAQSVLK